MAYLKDISAILGLSVSTRVFDTSNSGKALTALFF